MTAERAQAAGRLLWERGWIAVDHETEEGLIRNFIQTDWAGDDIFKGALGRAVLCQSPLLRAVLLHEIENLGRLIKPEWALLIDDLKESVPADLEWELLVTSPGPTSSATTEPVNPRSTAGQDFRNNGEGAFAEFDRRTAEDRQAREIEGALDRRLGPYHRPAKYRVVCEFEDCAIEFLAKDPRTRYCSDKHRQAAHRQRRAQQ